MPQQESFAQIGKVNAIRRLYEGTPFSPDAPAAFETKGASRCVSASVLMSEGIDFDLVYFPLKHLGHKCISAVTGQLYAALAQPRSLSVSLGVSSKLDYPQVSELWSGIVSAAREYGYASVALDLVPSINGLNISVSAVGEEPQLSVKRRPAVHSKDLICVSGCLGAAYLGQRLLEREKKAFTGAGAGSEEIPALSTYKMIVGDYLKPEIPAGVVGALADSDICPGYGCFVTRGLSDSILRLSEKTGLGAKIYADKIPFEGNSFQLGRELDIDPVSAAMNGGDDYRILYVVPILSMEKFRHDFQTFDIIGHMALPEAGCCLVTPEGAELPLTAQGWE